MPKKRGLLSGKFAPLHRGHQFLIETALAEMDEVFILLYDVPQITRIPLMVRAGWIQDLYPEVHLLEIWETPLDSSPVPALSPQCMEMIKAREITHFYSNEMTEWITGVEKRIVDPARRVAAISSAAIRNDPFTYRDYLHPRVYRDLITNIVFLGAAATGKSTLASCLAQEYNTVWMPEYGREYWEQSHENPPLSPGQLVEIAQGHIRREEALLCQANRYLFTDNNALITYMFSLEYHGMAAPQLAELAEQAASRYDLVFLCDADIPCLQTGCHSSPTHRQAFQKQLINHLLLRKLPFFRLGGDLKKRLQTVKKVLAAHQKYDNLLDLFPEL